MIERLNTPMKICAYYVRKIGKCSGCKLMPQCLLNHCKPVSRLGQYLAWLNLEALLQVESSLFEVGMRNIRLYAYPPNTKEALDVKAFAVVKAYKQSGLRVLFEVMLNGDEDLEAVKRLVLSEYARYRKGRYAK